MHKFPGCEKIIRAHQVLLNSINLDSWAQEFQYNISTFKESIKDFTEENLTPFFQKIYEEKCKDSLQPLEEMFVHIWNCRQG